MNFGFQLSRRPRTYSTEVQQRPLTTASTSDRPHPVLAVTAARLPRTACSSGRRGRARCVPDRPVNAGNLRSLPDSPVTGSPAYRQADPLRKPTFQAGGAVTSLRDCLGHVRRVKAGPLRGRFASLDTAATARGDGSYRGNGEEQGTRRRARREARTPAGHLPDLCTDLCTRRGGTD